MSAERGPEVRESDERRTASGAAAGGGGPIRVRARVLLMPCDTDKYFTLEEARREAAGERAGAALPAGSNVRFSRRLGNRAATAWLRRAQLVFVLARQRPCSCSAASLTCWSNASSRNA